MKLDLRSIVEALTMTLVAAVFIVLVVNHLIEWLNNKVDQNSRDDR